MKKLAALIETEECDVETDKIRNISECKAFPGNKTFTLIKKVKLCLISLCFNNINRNNNLFYLKSKNKYVLPY